jgi:hypothetical protein
MSCAQQPLALDLDRGMARFFIEQCRAYPAGSFVHLFREGVIAQVLAVNPRAPVQLLVIPCNGDAPNRVRRVLTQHVDRVRFSTGGV